MIESPIPGFKVKNIYTLTPAEYEHFMEIKSIKKSAQERLDTLHQKVIDCTRLMEGMMTEIKWREGWQDGDVVAFDPENRGILCLELERDGK